MRVLVLLKVLCLENLLVNARHEIALKGTTNNTYALRII